MSDRTTVYRFYAADGTLLYVGCTNNIGRRFGTHKSTKAWWPDVADIDIASFPTRREALAAERAAIESEHPMHNGVHNGWRKRLKSIENADPVLLEAMRLYQEGIDDVARARDSYHRVIREQIAAGRAQKDVVGVTGFTRETIRKISKETGND